MLSEREKKKEKLVVLICFIVSFGFLFFGEEMADDLVMIPEYLTVEELKYELRMRGVKVPASHKKESLSTCLEALLALERVSASLPSSNVSIVVEDELKVITELVGSIESLTKKFIAGNRRIKKERLSSGSVHLIGRLKKLAEFSLSPEQISERENLLARILESTGSLVKRRSVSTDPDISLALAGEDSEMDECDEDEEVIVTAPVIRSSFKYRSQPVEKWNVKFGGDSKLTLHQFLERVEELKHARNVSDEEMFVSAIDLFEGKALMWFRANKNRCDSWSNLINLLKKHFEPPDYRPRLFNDIITRTQDPSETFVDYFSSMSAMFNRYGDISEEIKLSILIRNLAPFYTMQLPDVSSLRELEEECLKIEVKKFRTDNYKPPSRNRNKYVEPDLACIRLETSSAASCSSEVPKSVVERRTPLAKLSCYHCRKEGHIKRDCPSLKNLVCYRCGELNVTVRTCKKCNPGNVPGRT